MIFLFFGKASVNSTTYHSSPHKQTTSAHFKLWKLNIGGNRKGTLSPLSQNSSKQMKTAESGMLTRKKYLKDTVP